jgi:hypothetical protein
MAILRNLLGGMALEESHRLRRRALRYGVTSRCGYAFDSSEGLPLQQLAQSHPFKPLVLG